jgi:sec-independent protein translocase protein TatB
VFNLQGSEIIVILLVALVVLGPEKLPDAVRRASRTYHEFKKMGAGFQSELKAALDEPMREMRETADLVRDAADPRKLAADTPPPAAGELGATDENSRPPTPAAEGDEGVGAEGAGDEDEVLGEMWEDEALYPGSSTVGTPPRRPDDPASDPAADRERVPASDAVSEPESDATDDDAQ